MAEANEALVAARAALQSGNAQHAEAALVLIEEALDGEDVEDVDAQALLGPQKVSLDDLAEANAERLAPAAAEAEEAAVERKVEEESIKAQAQDRLERDGDES